LLCDPNPMIEQVPNSGESLALEEAGKFICPRCSVRLPRPELVRHLWLEHQLVLDERSVRDPWRLIEDWLDEYCQSPKPPLLARCRALARRVDPEGGIRRVERLFLAHRIEDELARRALLTEARMLKVSLCPRCFAMITSAEEIPAQLLMHSEGNLGGHGYQVEISEQGFFSQLSVNAPGRRIYRGPEPDRWLSTRGAGLALAGPIVFLALLAAIFWPADSRPLLAVALILLVGLFAFRATHWIWRGSESILDRTIKYAWALLVPRLETQGFTSEDLTFMSDLALTSVGRGRADIRADNLQRVLNHIGKKVAADTAPVTQLAALWRLVIEDRAQAGDDPVLLVTSQIGQCFDGHLPLSFAENLLAGWESAKWTTENLARLRIILCERAFEAGFEVRDLLAAGVSAPALGEVMGTSRAEDLCRLRLLWSLRPQRPWDSIDSALTAFELARQANHGDGSHLKIAHFNGNSEIFVEYPDLLLATPGEPQVFLCGRGIVFEGTIFPEIPRAIKVKAKKSGRSIHSFVLIVDDQHIEFPDDPTDFVARLERWFRYWLGEFLPQATHVLGWQSPGLPTTFRLHKTVACPECRREIMPRIGDLAVLVDEPVIMDRDRSIAKELAPRGKLHG
jgi:hypothetical protein